jgi:hypothetical protein
MFMDETQLNTHRNLLPVLTKTAKSKRKPCMTIHCSGSSTSKSHQVLMLKLDVLDDETKEDDADILLVAVAAARVASRVKKRWHPSM